MPARPTESDSLLSDVRFPQDGKRSLLARRAGTTLLAVVVLAGALGLLGDRVDSVESQVDGHTLQVEYAEVARAGRNVPLEVTVSHPEGLGDQVVLALDARYFEVFETQAWFPEPSAQARDSDWLYLTFDTPQGPAPVTTFRAGYDAYLQPTSALRATGWAALVLDGERSEPLEFRTTLIP